MISKKYFIASTVIIILIFSGAFYYLNSRINENPVYESNNGKASLTKLELAQKFNDEITILRKT